LGVPYHSTPQKTEHEFASFSVKFSIPLGVAISFLGHLIEPHGFCALQAAATPEAGFWQFGFHRFSIATEWNDP